jgi:hypothetical protein
VLGTWPIENFAIPKMTMAINIPNTILFRVVPDFLMMSVFMANLHIFCFPAFLYLLKMMDFYSRSEPASDDHPINQFVIGITRISP